MNLTNLLVEIHRQGVILSAAGDRLKVDAPAGTLTPRRRAILARYKDELLAVLQELDTLFDTVADDLARLQAKNERRAGELWRELDTAYLAHNRAAMGDVRNRVLQALTNPRLSTATPAERNVTNQRTGQRSRPAATQRKRAR